VLKSGRETAGIEVAVAPGDRARGVAARARRRRQPRRADSMALLLRLGGTTS
jgi:hypothetical protein